jgi:hypothetical protein
MHLSLQGYVCWVIIHAIGLIYILLLGWALFHPKSPVHTVLLVLHLGVSGILLGIFLIALLYIKWQTPALNDLRWHGLNSNSSKMPIDVDIRIVNKHMAM